MKFLEEKPLLLDSRKWPGRLVLAGVALLTLFLAISGASLEIGNMLSDLTDPLEPGAAEVAELARTLSPGDPVAAWLEASTESNAAGAGTDTETIEELKGAVRLSPYDYTWWLELGGALEQRGVPGAERALSRAVELAPEYTLPRWQLGNYYLRAAEESKAFEQLSFAATKDPAFRDQVFAVTWDYFEGDQTRLESLAGDSPDLKVGLARFYASRGLAGKSIDVWRSIPTEVRNSNVPIATGMVRALFEKRLFRVAAEISEMMGLEPGAGVGEVENPGFEKEISKKDDAFFGWHIVPMDKVRVQLSRGRKHSGGRSLQTTFSGFEKVEYYNTFKTIALEPGSTYRLGFWLKTEDLKSAGRPMAEIRSADGTSVLASSEQFPEGSSDWLPISIVFTVPEDSEGVVFRSAREYCGENCAIFGTMWFDDFAIERIEKTSP